MGEIKSNQGMKIQYDFDSKYTRKLFNKQADGFFFLARMPNTYEGGGPDGATKSDVDDCANDLSSDLVDVEENVWSNHCIAAVVVIRGNEEIDSSAWSSYFIDNNY